MDKITADLRAKAYNAYNGCEAFDTYSVEKCRLVSVDMHYNVCYVLRNIPHKRTLDEVQILLTQLEKITDEDLLVIGKQMLPNCTNDEIIKQMVKEITLNRRKISCKVADKARELGYDCGYGSIPSLIEAGIAIDKTILNLQTK